MSQNIELIKVANLVLWTENPRDPIDCNANNQDIVNLAEEDKSKFWKLSDLAISMGDYYDFSEIPIVVYDNKKPVVYDGNRRVILAMIARGLVKTTKQYKKLPNVPDEIPCNVCSRDIALQSVLRKHGNKGSWRPLERDRFIQKYISGEKSDFIVIEEATGIISSSPKMNQGFVKEEVFNSANLNKLGIRINKGKLESRYDEETLGIILNDLREKIDREFLSTRQKRGDVIGVLDDSCKKLIEKHKDSEFAQMKIHQYVREEGDKACQEPTKRKTKRTLGGTVYDIFGKTLSLKSGDVNNLYRDISDLYTFYKMQKSKLSDSFSILIRMAIRLLTETASKECGFNDIRDYVHKYYTEAKKNLSQDEKTFLYSQNVNPETITALLHTGAHNYRSSSNFEQTLALSIIVGALLQESHRHK